MYSPDSCSQGVPETLVSYAHSKGADLVVVGSRGIGSMQRSMLSLVGLGSVSDYMARHLDCATLVVKLPPYRATPAQSSNGGG